MNFPQQIRALVDTQRPCRARRASPRRVMLLLVAYALALVVFLLAEENA